MTSPAATPAPSTQSGFNGENWATIIQGLSSGAQKGLESAAAYATTRKEARESKRRTLADLLNKAYKRNQGLYNMGQQYGDEGADFNSQIMQQVASGFINALK